MTAFTSSRQGGTGGCSNASTPCEAGGTSKDIKELCMIPVSDCPKDQDGGSPDLQREAVRIVQAPGRSVNGPLPGLGRDAVRTATAISGPGASGAFPTLRIPAGGVFEPVDGWDRPGRRRVSRENVGMARLQNRSDQCRGLKYLDNMEPELFRCPQDYSQNTWLPVNALGRCCTRLRPWFRRARQGRGMFEWQVIRVATIAHNDSRGGSEGPLCGRAREP